MPKFTSCFPDPRPSRANPEHRKIRKELESTHGFGWVPPVVLGLLGLTLAFDVVKEVEKHEEKHRKEEEEEEEERRRRRRRRRRDRDQRGGTRRRRRSYDDAGEEDGWEGGSEGGYGYGYGYDDENPPRRRIARRDEDRKDWFMPADDMDARNNDYEALVGGGPGMGRAEIRERGEADEDARYDGGLDRADQLEKGEGGVDEYHDYRGAYGAGRPRRRIDYGAPPDEAARPYYRGRSRREDAEDGDDEYGYEYVDEVRGRRELASRRSRPRPRRRSSDW